MSEFTPSTSQVRNVYADYGLGPSPALRRAEFNRMLEQERREATEQAFRAAAYDAQIEAHWQLEMRLKGKERDIDSIDRVLELKKLYTYRADRLEAAELPADESNVLYLPIVPNLDKWHEHYRGSEEVDEDE